ncbi:hypothetical protein PROPHIGD54-1_13 [Mycobacterium phage prophiGD54-1]|nr:hypothetical protein PROPHIGD102-2_13 [Mycobacterium phage prophi102-2]QSM03987.1 hypothetical protein PROPHIGD54-1_13 [Mycobacterium phage prophiGD54-1]
MSRGSSLNTPEVGDLLTSTTTSPETDSVPTIFTHVDTS